MHIVLHFHPECSHYILSLAYISEYKSCIFLSSKSIRTNGLCGFLIVSIVKICSKIGQRVKKLWLCFKHFYHPWGSKKSKTTFGPEKRNGPCFKWKITFQCFVRKALEIQENHVSKTGPGGETVRINKAFSYPGIPVSSPSPQPIESCTNTHTDTYTNTQMYFQFRYI